MEIGKESFAIMNGKKRGSMYKMIGDPIQGTVAPAFNDNVNNSEKFNSKTCIYDGNMR